MLETLVLFLGHLPAVTPGMFPRVCMVRSLVHLSGVPASLVRARSASCLEQWQWAVLASPCAPCGCSQWNSARPGGKGAKEKGAKDKHKTFNQKEKRKRDSGQSERGKSYVEGTEILDCVVFAPSRIVTVLCFPFPRPARSRTPEEKRLLRQQGFN